jgi:hypothetical protein
LDGFISVYSSGGGISNYGTLTLTNSTLSGNLADFGGGGISNYGTLTLTNSTLSGNSAYYRGGGGIENAGTLTLTNSTLSGNSADFGGGIYNYGTISNYGTLTLTNSTLSGNSADSGGGGIDNGGTLTVNNSTLSGNQANFGSDGGGIENAGTLTLSNSTLSGNSAHSYDFGGHIDGGEGGGIYNAGTVTVNNSTIAGNSAGTTGGGISNSSLATLHSGNTLIAANTAPADPDLLGNLGSQGHNLIGNDSGASGFDASDLRNVNPRLGPLQEKGGPTKTMALLAGSPALDAGDPAQLGVADQRGVLRSGGVNIGAYQASATAFLVTAPALATAGTAFDLTVQAVDPFLQPAVGYTGTVHFGSSDGQAVLPGDYTLTVADAGTHTFTNGVTLKTAGRQTVTATDIVIGSLTGSGTVPVNPAAADHLLFLQQPFDTVAGQTITPAVTVAIVDPFGNVVTGDNSDTITLSLGSNPSGGTLSGTLSVTVVNGVATFSDLSIDVAGLGYTLHASMGGGLPDLDSNPFNITL